MPTNQTPCRSCKARIDVNREGRGEVGGGWGTMSRVVEQKYTGERERGSTPETPLFVCDLKQ